MSDIDTAERPPPHPAADAATFPSRGRLSSLKTQSSILKTQKIHFTKLLRIRAFAFYTSGLYS
ncbi:MAG: hypothetical protein ACI4RP_03365 [Acutalibacteraceae bacterium]